MKYGEIWLTQLDPTLGAEIHKTRPCVIVNVDAVGKLPLRIVCPITEWSDKKKRFSWMVSIEATSQTGLNKYSIIDCFQPRALSIERFVKKLGCVSEKTLVDIKRSIVTIFDIPCDLLDPLM